LEAKEDEEEEEDEILRKKNYNCRNYIKLLSSIIRLL